MVDGLTTLERELFFDELEQVFEPPQAEALVSALDKVSVFRRETWVTRDEFQAAQARSEERWERIEANLERMSQDQAETKVALKELVEAQARTDASIKELTEAQARSEARLDRVEAAIERLTEAQARTDASIKELSEAQARTDATVRDLGERVGGLETVTRQLVKQVGGLSDSIGGDIEDIAYIVLHDVLKREFGWKVEPLERTWIKWNDTVEEIDVFGQAHDPQQPKQKIWIVGEAKHNLTVSEVKKFAKQVTRARKYLSGEVFAVCFCYRARPEVQELVRDSGLRLVFSYGKMV